MIHNKKDALIYIEPIFNKKINRIIVENYASILESFNKIDIPFIYLPKILTDNHFNKVIEYHYPHLKNTYHTHTETLYHVINSNLNLKIEEPTLIHLSDSGDVIHQFVINTPKVFASQKRLSLFTDNIRRKIGIAVKNDDKSTLFKTEDLFSDSLYVDRLDESTDKNIVDEPHILSKNIISFQKSYKKQSIDALSEEERFKIPDDLQKQIDSLREAGYLSHLIKYLEMLQNNTRKLSRLKITSDYKMYLMDYEMKEIKMSPLPKALYILFLNHIDGISFKALHDYEDELWQIYKNISMRENPIKAKLSIKKLTNPFDNSVHEKCSRIRESFLRVMADDIAQNYYITGSRGEVKRVILDRELLIYNK